MKHLTLLHSSATLAAKNAVIYVRARLDAPRRLGDKASSFH